MRVLQITDTHLLAEPGVEIYGADTYLSLESVLETAFALADPPELIVGTGDLSDDGSEGSYCRLRRLLLETGLPVYVVAGNHDSVEQMRASLLGGVIQMVPRLDLDPWRLVFLSSKVPGEPHGHLDGAELERLERTLTEDADRPVLACLHHSPTRPCPHRGCHLVNDDGLADLLAGYVNARAAVAGHSHLELERYAGHVALLTTPSTGSQCRHAQLGEGVDHEDFWASHEFDPSRHGFRMLTLQADGRLETRVHWVRNPRLA